MSESFCVIFCEQLHPVDCTVWLFELFDDVGREKEWKSNQKSRAPSPRQLIIGRVHQSTNFCAAIEARQL